LIAAVALNKKQLLRMLLRTCAAGSAAALFNRFKKLHAATNLNRGACLARLGQGAKAFHDDGHEITVTCSDA
jgi:hypothetical protein